MDYTKIKEAAQAYLPAMTKFLRDLIAIPSESCEEKEVVECIQREMRGGGRGEAHHPGDGSLGL